MTAEKWLRGKHWYFYKLSPSQDRQVWRLQSVLHCSSHCSIACTSLVVGVSRVWGNPRWSFDMKHTLTLLRRPLTTMERVSVQTKKKRLGSPVTWRTSARVAWLWPIIRSLSLWHSCDMNTHTDVRRTDLKDVAACFSATFETSEERVEVTHCSSMSGCLIDTLENSVCGDDTLAAPSPTRPRGLFSTGRKSSAEKRKRSHLK